MQTNRNQSQKRAGLKVRTDIRAGAYFSITFDVGRDSAGAAAAAAAPSAGGAAEAAPVA